MKKLLIALAVLAVASPVVAGEQTMNAMIELLRQDIRTERIAIIEEVMEFTQTEADAFWPLYKEYEAKANKINDERWVLIKDYADHYGNVSDEKASDLIQKSLELNIKEANLNKAYFKKYSKAIAPKRAAQFMQLQSQIELLVKLQVASELPLIE
jgi:hypothetical protein